MNEQELAQIEERAAKATPGPWQPINPADFDNQNPGWDVNGPYTIFDNDGYGFLDEHTAAFIAHAINDIPALLAEVRRLTAELDATHKYANGLRDEIDGQENALSLSKTQLISAGEALDAQEIKNARLTAALALYQANEKRAIEALEADVEPKKRKKYYRVQK